MQYCKPSLDISEQIKLLESRGLIITSRVNAENFLKQVNYYRFSAYCIPFELSRHKFKPNVTFEQIQQIYEFDRRLRFLIDESLEIIEIAMRTRIAYCLSCKYGSFVHENPKNFFVRFDHNAWISKLHEETERSNEVFVTHYKNRYDGCPVIPLWMAVEIMSFSSLSKLLRNLFRDDQIEISLSFELHYTVLLSWMHTFTYTRNICAHHGRLWNRELAISIKIPKNKQWEDVNSKRIIAVVFAINRILSKLPYDDNIKKAWRKKIEELFFTKIDGLNVCLDMGIKTDFKSHPLWNFKKE